MQNLKKHTLSAIKLAQSLKDYFKKNNLPFPKSLKIKDYQANLLNDESTLVFSTSQNDTVSIDTKELDSDGFITLPLIKEWQNKNLTPLLSSKNLDTINEINKIIDSIIDNIEDEIHKSMLKENLEPIAKQIHEENLLNIEEIHKRISNAMAQLLNGNTKDPLTNCYKADFYHNNLAGQRPNDSARSFDTITSLQKKTSEPLAVAFLDANNFKTINDTYGHETGDKVLKAITKLAQSSLDKSNSLFVRRGGDEFVILAPASQLANLTKSILNKEVVTNLTKSCQINPDHYIASTSIGIKALDLSSLNKENSSQIIKDAILQAEANSELCKKIAHYEFASGRADETTLTQYEDCTIKFEESLSKELNLKGIEIYGRIPKSDEDYLCELQEYLDKENSLKISQSPKEV